MGREVRGVVRCLWWYLLRWRLGSCIPWSWHVLMRHQQIASLVDLEVGLGDGEEEEVVVMILRRLILALILGSGITAMRDKKDGDLASGVVRRRGLLLGIWLGVEDRDKRHQRFRGIEDGLEAMIMAVEADGVLDRVGAAEMEVVREVLGLEAVQGMKALALAPHREDNCGMGVGVRVVKGFLSLF